MQYDENAEKYGYEGEMTPLKCDKLTAYKGDVTIPVYGTIADAEVYLKKDVDAVIAELKSDIADLRDDKKLTDAILDERNAEIAELKEDLHTAKEQVENIINSASSIMLFQDKVNDNTCQELRHHKYKRCLAMVKYCHESAMWLEEYGVTKSATFMLRWQKRWMKLAEKFKEAKEYK